MMSHEIDRKALTARLRESAIIAVVVISALVAGLDAAPAGVRQTTSGLRMYVFNCGTLKDRSPETYNLTRDQVESVDMADPCFLIVHPRGSLLWETGLNDAQYNTPGGFGPRHDIVETSLKSQLAAVGYSPDKITYLAMSHWHGDHAGNANDYAGSTWIVQRAEQEAMFQVQAAPTPAGNQATFNALKSSKAIVVDGDHDVFGDGTVIVKATPGHTPGHQSLFVKLSRTGAVVLSGDLYHFPGERTFGKTPTGEAQRGLTTVSRQRLEEFIKTNKAQLWIQHDMIGYRRMKLAPQYYE
jgi:N-acyl homoserine lactone hydrolase